MEQGVYHLCEFCQDKIPAARLNALPYSTTCVNCQRNMENHRGWANSRGVDWKMVWEVGPPFEDQRELDLAAIEIALCK